MNNRDGYNRGGRGGGGRNVGARQSRQLPKQTARPGIVPVAEVSKVETIPLLIYPCSMEDFIVFEEAIISTWPFMPHWVFLSENWTFSVGR